MSGYYEIMLTQKVGTKKESEMNLTRIYADNEVKALDKVHKLHPGFRSQIEAGVTKLEAIYVDPEADKKKAAEDKAARMKKQKLETITDDEPDDEDPGDDLPPPKITPDLLLEDVDGMPENWVTMLNQAGHATVADIAMLTPEDLTEIKGIGAKTAGQIFDLMKIN